MGSGFALRDFAQLFSGISPAMGAFVCRLFVDFCKSLLRFGGGENPDQPEMGWTPGRR
jgi:hypothetical protein